MVDLCFTVFVALPLAVYAKNNNNNYTPSGKKKKKKVKYSNVEKSHKSACVSLML